MPLKNSGIVILGAGLPRTGTLSTKTALTQLLDGPCYHMVDVFAGDADTLEFWNRAMAGELAKEDWRDHMEKGGWRAGVDYPISLFYK